MNVELEVAERAMLAETVAEIRRIMSRQGVTAAELARRLGQTPGHVSQMLTGDRNLTLRTVARILHALDATGRVQASIRPRYSPAWRVWRHGAPTTLTIHRETEGWAAGCYAWKDLHGWGTGHPTPTAAADAWAALFGYRWHSLVPIPRTNPPLEVP